MVAELLRIPRANACLGPLAAVDESTHFVTRLEMSSIAGGTAAVFPTSHGWESALVECAASLLASRCVIFEPIVG